MNNNRNQNNRRRGRGNRNQGGGGGGNQGNRIDSRARGNAPQMLDKFKKLAQDAQHNGDRVQAEYYLQFADHYFRVIADNRSRQDDQRGDQRGDQRLARREDREQDEFEVEDEEDGEDRRRFETRRERPRREGGDERPRNRPDNMADDTLVSEGSEGSPFEPEDNPFARESREPASGRAKRAAPRARRAANGQEPGIDAAVLPPSFSANDAGDRGEDATAEAAPRRRRKRGDGETLSAVG
ncbi:MAG TPA: DUF4167 domain-containing protein [Qipengyuania sp.]|nr:DUF4167 domain-containing protein [Qipengyuania sp.]